jgi:hypothetical protein
MHRKPFVVVDLLANRIAASAIVAVALLAGCGGSEAGMTGDDQNVTQATVPADAFKVLVGKWKSTVTDVPKTGELPFESNIRSLEFTTADANSVAFIRHKLILVIRSDKDETFPHGTYRTVAAEPGSKKGTIAVTEGGSTSSQFDYELDGDHLRLHDRDATRDFVRDD